MFYGNPHKLNISSDLRGEPVCNIKYHSVFNERRLFLFLRALSLLLLRVILERRIIIYHDISWYFWLACTEQLFSRLSSIGSVCLLPPVVEHDSCRQVNSFGNVREFLAYCGFSHALSARRAYMDSTCCKDKAALWKEQLKTLLNLWKNSWWQSWDLGNVGSPPEE